VGISIESQILRTRSFRATAITHLLLIALFAVGCTSNPVPYDNPQSSAAVIEVLGTADAELQEAANQVVVALQAASSGDNSALAAMVSDSGLYVFPPFSCKPGLLKRNSMNEPVLSQRFRVENCHEDDIKKRPTLAWSQFFESIENSKALKKTDRIVLNQRHGVGFNTGSSTLAEQQFAAERHKFVVYFHLGTAAANKLRPIPTSQSYLRT